MTTSQTEGSPGHASVMALDVGDKRIGLAVTDALGLTAQPLFTVHRERGTAALRQQCKSIGRFIRQHGVSVVVIGHPLNADGTPGPQAAKTLVFLDALKAALAETHPGLVYHLLDERLTSMEAHALLDASSSRALRSSGRDEREARKDLIDQVAAVLLLEAYLSHERGPSLLPDPDLL